MASRRGIRGAIVGAVSAVLATAVLALAGSAPASALSCAGTTRSMPETIDWAVANDGTVFVGTVVSTTNDGTWATFAVDEVWAGDVPDEVEVKGDNRHGPGELQILGYEPPEFEPGAQYLVIPTQVRPPYDSFFGSENGEYELPLCSDPPSEFSEGYGIWRPASARIVERDEPVEIDGEVALPPEQSKDTPWLAVGGAAVIVFGSITFSAWRRRRRAVDVEVDESYL